MSVDATYLHACRIDWRLGCLHTYHGCLTFTCNTTLVVYHEGIEVLMIIFTVMLTCVCLLSTQVFRRMCACVA